MKIKEPVRPHSGGIALLNVAVIVAGTVAASIGWWALAAGMGVLVIADRLDAIAENILIAKDDAS